MKIYNKLKKVLVGREIVTSEKVAENQCDTKIDNRNQLENEGGNESRKSKNHPARSLKSKNH